MSGTMCDYLTFGGTVIVYGLLTEQPVGNINTIGFIGKDLKMETFFLGSYLAQMSLIKYMEFVMRCEPLYRDDLSTEVFRCYGLH